MKTIAHQTEGSRGRLLVVEDDLVHRMIIGKIAAKLGYDAMTASSFDVAATLLQQHVFGAMTLDLSLGEHDGVKLLRLVAECGLHGMPIVIISGCEERILNSTRRVAEGLGLSLVSCLSKPLHLDELRLALYLPPRARHPTQGAAPPPDITRERILAGLQRDEFSVEFQPKIELATGKVVGAEALARWRSPELGAVSPATFIPVVERLGLMPELTNFVLSASITQGRRLIKQHAGFTIAVNVSGSLMGDLNLPERIEGMLQASSVSPGSLIVEVTESVAMSDVDRAMDVRAHEDQGYWRRDRRFRHRLFVAGGAGAASVQRVEDRPVLRQGLRHRPRHDEDHRGLDRARPRLRDEGGRGRHRQPANAGEGTGGRLRHRPRLSVRAGTAVRPRRGLDAAAPRRPHRQQRRGPGMDRMTGDNPGRARQAPPAHRLHHPTQQAAAPRRVTTN
jgi:DNA-binding response OmpR family regulator